MACCWNDELLPSEPAESWRIIEGEIRDYTPHALDGTPDWIVNDVKRGAIEWLRAFRREMDSRRHFGRVEAPVRFSVDYVKKSGGYWRYAVMYLPDDYYDWLETQPRKVDGRPPVPRKNEWTIIPGWRLTQPLEDNLRIHRGDFYRQYLEDRGSPSDEIVLDDHWTFHDTWHFGGEFGVQLTAYFGNTELLRSTYTLEAPVIRGFDQDTQPIFLFYGSLETYRRADDLGKVQLTGGIARSQSGGYALPLGYDIADVVTAEKFIQCFSVWRTYNQVFVPRKGDIESHLVQDAAGPTMITSSETSRQFDGNFVVDTNEDNVVERYGASCIPRALAAPPVWYGEIVDESYDATHLDPARNEFVHFEGNAGVATHFPPADYISPALDVTGVQLRSTRFIQALTIDSSPSRNQEFAMHDRDPNAGKYRAYVSDQSDNLYAVGLDHFTDSSFAEYVTDIPRTMFIAGGQHPRDWSTGDNQAGEYWRLSDKRFCLICDRWAVNTDFALQSQWLVTHVGTIRKFSLRDEGAGDRDVDFGLEVNDILPVNAQHGLPSSALFRVFLVHFNIREVDTPIGDLFDRTPPYSQYLVEEAT